MSIRLRSIVLPLSLLAAVGGRGPVQAQDENRFLLTRPGVEAAMAAAEAQGDAATAALMRQWLTEGNLLPGDAVSLEVEGEAALSGNFTVTGSRTLALPGMGEVPLRGLLRSELQDAVRVYLSRRIREPVVRAHALVRLAVLGQVRTPGFYAVRADVSLSEAIMAAGGPLPTSRMAAVRVDREGRPVWHPKRVQAALQSGDSLDRLGVRSGDQIMVPADTGGRSAQAMRLATTLPAAVLAVVALLRL